MKLLITLLVVVSLGAAAATQSANLVGLHKNAKANAGKCVSCHSDIPKQKSDDPKVKAFHPLHLDSPLLKLACVDCHKSVDLREKSGAKVRKQVDPGICSSCHSPWPTPKMHDPSFQKMDCTKCHPDWKEKMKNVGYVNLQKVSSQDCFGCHGGRPLYANTHSKKGDHAIGH